MGIPANNSLGVSAAGTPPAGDLAQAVLSGKLTAVGPSQPFPFHGFMNFAAWASVNTTLTVTAGSTAATVASATGLAAGCAINSTLVPAGTTIGALSGTNVTLAFPSQTYWGTMDGAGNVTLNGPPSAAALAELIGASVTGTNVPSGATVASVSANGVALSAAPTKISATTAPQSFTFAPTGNAVAASGADSAATFTGAGVTWTGTLNLERSFDGGQTFVLCNVGGSGTLAQWAAGPVSVAFQEPERGVLYRANAIALSAGNINFRLSQTSGGAMSLMTGGVAN